MRDNLKILKFLFKLCVGVCIFLRGVDNIVLLFFMFVFESKFKGYM